MNQGNLNLVYCPTDEVIGDFMTKPLHSNLVYCPTHKVIGDIMTKPLQGLKFMKF